MLFRSLCLWDTEWPLFIILNDEKAPGIIFHYCLVYSIRCQFFVLYDAVRKCKSWMNTLTGILFLQFLSKFLEHQIGWSTPCSLYHPPLQIMLVYWMILRFHIEMNIQITPKHSLKLQNNIAFGGRGERVSECCTVKKHEISWVFQVILAGIIWKLKIVFSIRCAWNIALRGIFWRGIRILHLFCPICSVNFYYDVKIDRQGCK